MKNATYIKNCRLCKSENLSDILINLGNTPLANDFLPIITEQECYPLQIIKCLECCHYQLNIKIDPNILFKHYSYVSGTSPANIIHFTESANESIQKFNIKSNDLVVEIASNDGTLLNVFKKYNCKIVGIEPAENIADIANQKGIFTINDFFTSSVAEQIINNDGYAKYVIANNVLAHCDTLDEIAKGIKLLIQDDGYFSFEVSYFEDVINNMAFTTIYHEHESYYNVLPAENFFKKYGIYLFDVKQIPNHGGSIRVFACGHQLPLTQNYKNLIDNEINKGMQSRFETFNIKNFNNNIKYLKKITLQHINYYLEQNYKILCYGAPAKYTTFDYTIFDKNYFECVIEDNPLKINTFTPGRHCPIYNFEYLKNYKENFVLFISAWNFSDSIIQKLKDNNIKCICIVPCPDFKVYKL